MYRAPDNTPRCTRCANPNVTPPTLFYTSEGVPRITFRDARLSPGFLNPNATTDFEADQASVCLDCGCVMLSLSPERLQQLRAQAAHLSPSLLR